MLSPSGDKILSLPLASAVVGTDVLPVVVSGITSRVPISSFQAVVGQTYNVKNYGVLGDGATNDSAALSTLVNTTALAGSTIYFPAGNYKLGSDISFPAGLLLVFAPGAYLSPSVGVTATILSEFSLTPRKIFGIAGTVVLSGPVGEVYPEWWGAARDGATNDGAAIQAALATGKTVRLGKGTYSTGSTNLVHTTSGQKIYGAGWVQTTLKPSAGLTGAALTLVGSSVADGFSIDGSLTTNAVGLLPGSRNTIRTVNLHHFGGANGIGFDVPFVVGGAYEYVSSEYNTTGVRIGYADAGPTSVHFKTLRAASNTGKGIVFLSGRDFVFDLPTAESNGEEGFYAANVTASANVSFELRNAWFEDNWTSVASGAGKRANYQLYCNATNSGAQLMYPRLISPQFDGTTTSASAFKLSNTRDPLIASPKMTQVSSAMGVISGSTPLQEITIKDWAVAYSGSIVTALDSLTVGTLSGPAGDSAFATLVAGTSFDFFVSVSSQGYFMTGTVHVPPGGATAVIGTSAYSGSSTFFSVSGTNLVFHNATGSTQSFQFRLTPRL